MEKVTDLDESSPYTRFAQQAHMVTELINFFGNTTDWAEREQWKTLKERSGLRDYCLRISPPTQSMKPR